MNNEGGKFAIAGWFLLFWLLLNSAIAQTCNVKNSVPATLPTSGNFDVLVRAGGDSSYSVAGTRLYDSYDVKGKGAFLTIPTSNYFWNDNGNGSKGPLKRCGVWSQANPLRLGFSVCVDIPAETDYYMGFAADNSGMLKIDGDTLLEGIDFNYWDIYKIHLTKGIHLVEFAVINFGGPAALGFEIYNNTRDQVINALSYNDLNIIFTTQQELGLRVEEGDPATSYSCPPGYALDYCTSNVPVCSQFVPVSNLTITNPPPVCYSAGADITTAQVTAGSPSSLTYSYWRDSLATIPLASPDHIKTSGTYYIMGSFNGCSAVKPVTVLINSVNSTTEKTICLGSSYLGHTKTGEYADTLIAANGCDSISTLKLTVKPKTDTTISAFICLGGDYMGHTKSGIYRDTLVAAGGCDSLVTLNLTVSPDPDFGLVASICPGDSIILNPGIFSQYRWQDNSTAPTFTVKAPGAYWVTVTDEKGCVTTDTVVIKGTACLTSKINNTFTPNGDGINDTWVIDGLSSHGGCTVDVYSRWGQLVFKSKGYSKPWDGTFNGKQWPAGTYYYVINLNDGSPPFAGYITLLR